MMTAVQIKICGVTNVKDARACSELGTSMVGFNFYPQGSRYIEPKVARRIIDAVSPRVLPVGAFVDAGAQHIGTTADAAGVGCVQLHGSASADTCRDEPRYLRVRRPVSRGPRL